MIEVGQFAIVQNDNLAEHGINCKDLVYVAGDVIVLVSEEDPYALRRIFIAAKMDGDSIDAEGGGFTIDGLSLVPVDEFTQKRLDNQKKLDFDVDESGTIH